MNSPAYKFHRNEEIYRLAYELELEIKCNKLCSIEVINLPSCVLFKHVGVKKVFISANFTLLLES